MDVLPVQASAVLCERMFSAAADTDTPDRSRLHPALMEALQVIKFSIKKERLNTVMDLVTHEQELVMDAAVPLREVCKLTDLNRLGELTFLLNASHACAPEYSVDHYA